jgi:TolB-like protein
MMRKMAFWALLFAGIAGTLSAQAKPRLGILPFTGGVGGDGETIAMLLSYRPEILNAFTVVPRTSNINIIMAEQQFQRTGLTDSDTISSLGRQLNADFVVAGHIQRLGDRNLVLITIINVESLEQIAGDYREYVTIEEIQALLPDMAKKLISATKIDTSKLPKLAVLPFNIPASGVNVQDAEVLAQLLATEIANSGKYAVLSRTKTIELAMSELQIQRSGLTDPNSIKAIGRATNAQYVLAGDVRSLGTNNLFMASILNIEDASQLTGDAKNYRSITDGLQLMGELAKSLISIVPASNSAPQPGQKPAEAASTVSSPKKPAKSPADYQNFSAGGKFMIGILNLVLGFGSYASGDWAGGLVITTGYAVSVAMIMTEISVISYYDDFAAVTGTIGLVGIGTTALYGFIRPFAVRKSGGGSADALSRLNFAVVPGAQGIKAAHISYTWNF